MGCYFGQDYLAAQLDSIQAQSYRHWKVWAADDGSTDATPELLERYQASWGRDRLAVRRGPQQGFVANFLALVCDDGIQADYFAYSDQDDVWAPEKLANAVAWLASVPAGIPALYCSRTRLFKGVRTVGCSPRHRRPPSFANALVQNIAGGNTMVFNRAARRLLAHAGPDVKVVAHQTRLTSENVLDIIAGYDVIIDGADNFPTRYLLNDAALKLKKPVIHASIFRFEGQMTTFLPDSGPCYRCLYPDPPPPGMAPSCQEAGVLGVLPGIVGTIQATEAIKLILGIGESLSGRLLVFDALATKFRTLKLRKDPECRVCSKHPDEIELIDYEQFCAIGG